MLNSISFITSGSGRKIGHIAKGPLFSTDKLALEMFENVGLQVNKRCLHIW